MIGSNGNETIIESDSFTPIFYPKFNRSKRDSKRYSDDIALIKLHKKISFSYNIGLACLPFEIEEIPNDLIRVGWKEDSEEIFLELESLPITKVDINNCSNKYFSKEILYNSITDKQFCAGTKSKFDKFFLQS